MINNNSKFNNIITKGIEWGLIVFAFGSPFSISIAQMGFITSLLCWITKIIFIREKKIIGTFIDIFLLIFFIGSLLGSLFSIDILFSLAASRGLWIISIVYLLVNNINYNNAKKILTILLSVSCLMGIYGIFQSLTGIDLWRNNVERYGVHFFGAVGGFGLHLTYGGYQMMTALILLSISMYGMNDLKKISKIFIIIATVIVTLSAVMSFARTAWIGLFAGLIIIGLTGIIIRSKRAIITSASIFIILGVLFLLVKDFRYRFFLLIAELKFSGRRELWDGAWMMIKDNPVFGVGTGLFDKHFLEYKPDYVGAYGHTHNDMLGIYLRVGIIGFTGYILMLITYFRKMTKKAISLFKTDRLGFAMSIGFISVVVSFLTAGLGQNYFTDSETSMLLWCVIGLSLIIYYKAGKKENK